MYRWGPRPTSTSTPRGQEKPNRRFISTPRQQETPCRTLRSSIITITPTPSSTHHSSRCVIRVKQPQRGAGRVGHVSVGSQQLRPLLSDVSMQDTDLCIHLPEPAVNGGGLQINMLLKHQSFHPLYKSALISGSHLSFFDLSLVLLCIFRVT